MFLPPRRWRHPSTIQMGVRDWLEMVARSPLLAAAGHEIRALTLVEWSAAMGTLAESNPLFVFRDTHKLGLGGIAAHNHAAASAALASAVQDMDSLQQASDRPLAYTQADVDAMVKFILAHGCQSWMRSAAGHLLLRKFTPCTQHQVHSMDSEQRLFTRVRKFTVYSYGQHSSLI